MNSVKKPSSLEEALELYWRVDSTVSIPNYVNFSKFITIHFETPNLATPLHLSNNPDSIFEMQFIKAANSNGVIFTENGPQFFPKQSKKIKNNNLRLKKINKIKLLMSVYNECDLRTREFITSLSNSNFQYNLTNRNSSQSDIRRSLFYAINKGDQHTASKMLGQLREEKHDVGELEFLEASVLFYSNKFKDAIYFARQVPVDSLDWPRSYMILLESYAYQGDFNSIKAEIIAHPEFLFPQGFILYIGQITVKNSLLPGETFKQFSDLIKNRSPAVADCDIFNMWNRQTCELAVQFVEQVRSFKLTESAAFQSESDTDFLYILEENLLFKQIYWALSFDPELIDIAKNEPNRVFLTVLSRLMTNTNVEIEDLLQALDSEWRIGERSLFLDNVLLNLNKLSKFESVNSQQIILWAYQEARLENRKNDAKKIRQTIDVIPSMFELSRDIEKIIASDRIEKGLSPMAILSWRSANLNLRQAVSDNLVWNDAGMISLGFFRILELEFNRRLMSPALRNVDLFLMKEIVTTITNTSSAGKKASQFWLRMIPLIEQNKLKQKGLELGALELILAKIEKLNGPDIALKTHIQAEVLRRLTPVGVEAFLSGDLARRIDETAREKFRNPPAHTRYIPLSIAQECRRYVENVLLDLFVFTVDPSDGDTLH